MATYKQPQKQPTVVVGEEDNKAYLRDTLTSVGNVRSGPYKPTKTDGITMRGYGAATKGIKSRGPMA